MEMLVDPVRSRVRHDSLRAMGLMVSELGINCRTIFRVIHKNPHMSGYHSTRIDSPTPQQRRARGTKDEKFKCLVGVKKNSIACDERGQPFPTSRNPSSSIWQIPMPSIPRVHGMLNCCRSTAHHSPGVMVWGWSHETEQDTADFPRSCNQCERQSLPERHPKTVQGLVCDFNWWERSNHPTTGLGTCRLSKVHKMWLRKHKMGFLNDAVYHALLRLIWILWISQCGIWCSKVYMS